MTLPAIALATTLLSAALGQTAASDKARAIDLARQGHTAAALQVFERLAALDPADAEAKLWIGRLDLRLGRVDKAEALFRAVLAQHPGDVDARVALGAALTRRGAWQEALTILEQAERDAGANADVYAAIARASRRGGDNRRALDYYKRAVTLSPNDPDIRDGYEALALSYGHGVAIEGFGQRVTPGATVASGSLAATVRAAPRLHLEGLLRAQTGDRYADVIAGAGLLWRAGTSTTVSMRASGGSGNVAMPNTDAGGELLRYAGSVEIGASVRALRFTGADVVALSPLLAVDTGGRWRLDGRYTFSRTRFARVARASGDHSALARLTLRGWRRLWLNGGYAYGIESFEDLTRDRIGTLDAHTATGGLRVNLRSLTLVSTTWEHQWRPNRAALDRVTLTLAQFFP